MPLLVVGCIPLDGSFVADRDSPLFAVEFRSRRVGWGHSLTRTRCAAAGVVHTKLAPNLVLCATVRGLVLRSLAAQLLVGNMASSACTHGSTPLLLLLIV